MNALLNSALKQINTVGEFLYWNDRFNEIPGYLSSLEGYTLKLLAAKGPGTGEIVEVGSFMGRSTCWLAAGTKQYERERVAAIDHFGGSTEHQPGGICENENEVAAILRREGTLFNSFNRNLRSTQLDDYVEPLIGTSEDVAKNWKKPIRLLFIDGDHSYEASEKDYRLWSPFVIRGGLIAFHDIGVWPGVTRLFRQLLRNAGLFRQILQADTLRVLQKL